MGEPSGFLEYRRRSNPAQPPRQRILHFDEFHPPLPPEERCRQGARCMACGVPFCQSGTVLGGTVSGCPLHNLIPEWNDLICTGRLEEAAARLLKTNPFPEFTGRVCPALCEAACTCSLHGDAVTIRDNELSIIEDAWTRGLIRPRPPKARTGRRVAVVGSGPAGLAAADALNRWGHSVTVFEKADRPGGLLLYGIPNMKLEKGIVQRRIRLMEQEGIVFCTGVDVGRDVTAEQLLGGSDAVVLCCGAGRPRDLDVKNRDVEGVYFAVDFLTATTRSLLDSGLRDGRFISARGKRVVVVGGGDTGNDCVGTAIRHGCENVIQLEMLPRPPKARAEDNPWPQWPRILKTDYGQEEAIALFRTDPRRYQTTVTELISGPGGCLASLRTVMLDARRRPVAGTEEVLPCDLLLIAAGFLGPQDDVPTAFGVERDGRSNVKTEGFATSVPGVFAAGDMRRGQSLVVWAVAEGRAAAMAVDQYLMGHPNMV